MIVSIEGLVLRGRRLVEGTVAFEGGRLVRPSRRPVSLLEGWAVLPGLVDIQVNGFAGAEIGDDPDQWAAVAAALPSVGVTAFCPTLVTRTLRAYRRAAAANAAVAWPTLGAKNLGVHLEGPFLAPGRVGAHPAGAIRDPDPSTVARLLADFEPRIVTLAPERPGAIDAIRSFARTGALVACGHTDADAPTAEVAIRAGARLLTHAFNAMAQITSREPSALVAFLGQRRAYVSLIADSVHVEPRVAALVARLAGPRLVLISDSVEAAGMGPGRFQLGATAVTSDGVVVRGVGGQLAGSAAGLAVGPQVLRAAGISRAAALDAASGAPRRLLGLPLGELGDPADLVIVDQHDRPQVTITGGRVAWSNPDSPLAIL